MVLVQESRLSDCTHQSLQVPAIAAGRETRRRHPSTESPPTAITSASEREEHGQRALSVQRSKYIKYLNGLRTCAWRYSVPFEAVLSQAFLGMNSILSTVSDGNSEMS
jgi:hypothetical protein